MLPKKDFSNFLIFSSPVLSRDADAYRARTWFDVPLNGGLLPSVHVSKFLLSKFYVRSVRLCVVHAHHQKLCTVLETMKNSFHIN